LLLLNVGLVLLLGTDQVRKHTVNLVWVFKYFPLFTGQYLLLLLLGVHGYEFRFVFFPDLAVKVVHRLLFLLLLFVLPDHLVPERVVVRLLVHLIVQNLGFIVCDLNSRLLHDAIFIYHEQLQKTVLLPIYPVTTLRSIQEHLFVLGNRLLSVQLLVAFARMIQKAV
jgi:hypothetical protein